MNAAIFFRHVCFSSAALITAIVALPESVLAQGLLLDGDRLANPANAKQFVKVGELLPVAALKEGFPGYSIIATAGEDCSVCAFGSRLDGCRIGGGPIQGTREPVADSISFTAPAKPIRHPAMSTYWSTARAVLGPSVAVTVL
jgi:hypothetical protein